MTEARAEAMLAAIAGTLHGGGEEVGDLPDSCVGCGHCCGRVLPADERDVAALKRYARRHGVKPTVPNLVGVTGYEQACAWLDPATRLCRVWSARPKVCRCWASPKDEHVIGTRPGQPCGLSPRLAKRAWRGPAAEMGELDTWTMEWRATE